MKRPKVAFLSFPVLPAMVSEGSWGLSEWAAITMVSPGRGTPRLSPFVSVVFFPTKAVHECKMFS